jgi:hypothetical protein
MRILIYQSKTNTDLGVSIQVVKNEITVWVDEYEGGEAYQDDWSYDEDQPDFKNIQEAQDYIYQKYGELKFIEEY